MTPHVTILGTPYRRKWEALVLENCRRFAAGQPLLNVVDTKEVVDTKRNGIDRSSSLSSG
jgi:phosphoglycerate dehydrogenase-like enzyme